MPPSEVIVGDAKPQRTQNFHTGPEAQRIGVAVAEQVAQHILILVILAKEAIQRTLA